MASWSIPLGQEVFCFAVGFHYTWMCGQLLACTNAPLAELLPGLVWDISAGRQLPLSRDTELRGHGASTPVHQQTWGHHPCTSTDMGPPPLYKGHGATTTVHQRMWGLYIKGHGATTTVHQRTWGHHPCTSTDMGSPLLHPKKPALCKLPPSSFHSSGFLRVTHSALSPNLEIGLENTNISNQKA